MTGKKLSITWSGILLMMSLCMMAGGILLLSKGNGHEESTAESATKVPDATVPVRILPLGNSITQSDSNHRSYRYNLWIKLTDAGVKFDFIGSLNSNHGGSPAWPNFNGHSFDPDHEGHWGWTVNEILGGAPGEEEKGKLSEWLRGYTPDIVLIHLGTNDAFNDEDISDTVSGLRQIIEILRAENPSVAILLAKLIPTAYAVANSRINELNAEIDRVAEQTSTAASPVIVVDQNSGFDAEFDTYDLIHPNVRGEEKLAARWFYALQGLLAVRMATPDN